MFAIVGLNTYIRNSVREDLRCGIERVETVLWAKRDYPATVEIYRDHNDGGREYIDAKGNGPSLDYVSVFDRRDMWPVFASLGAEQADSATQAARERWTSGERDREAWLVFAYDSLRTRHKECYAGLGRMLEQKKDSIGR